MYWGNADIKISSEHNRAFDFINEIHEKKKKYDKAEPKFSIEFGRAVLSAIFTSRENYEITFAILRSKKRDRNNFLLSRPYWKNLHIVAGQKPSRPFFNPLLLVRVPLKALKKTLWTLHWRLLSIKTPIRKNYAMFCFEIVSIKWVNVTFISKRPHSEAALHKRSYKKGFWRYVANLQIIIMIIIIIIISFIC